jgi:SOS response associated peptidase (SRAP)
LIPWWRCDTSNRSQIPQHHSHTAEADHAEKVLDVIFVARDESPEPLQPGKRSFDTPTLLVRAGKTKQPYCFEVSDGDLFAFAGLWERWRDSSGNWIKTCAILTTTPNAVTAAVQDRMPVILHPDTYDLWLDPGFTDLTAVSEMLKPYDARLMRRYPVSKRINHAANDDPECCVPVATESPSRSQLF